VYWFMTFVVLWWAHSITPLIRGGYYQVNQAVLLAHLINPAGP